LTGLSALLTPEVCVVLLIDHQPFQFAKTPDAAGEWLVKRYHKI
jgi:hypothetical protein